MGINSWVYARRQITDERQWSYAMQEIKLEFEEDENFVEYTWDDKDGQYKNRKLSDTEISYIEHSECLNFVGVKESVNHYYWTPSFVCPCPPTIFEFTKGEHPRLPVFGRHFRICCSKLLSGSQDVGPYLQEIYEILSRYFPGNIGYFTEDYDNDYPDQTKLHKDEPECDKKIIYDTWRSTMPMIENGTTASEFQKTFLQNLSLTNYIDGI